MKILFLTNIYPPPFIGGYEMRCKEQVEELKKRGHQTFVLTSRWGLKKSEVEDHVYRLLHYKIALGSVRKKGVPNLLNFVRRYNQLKCAFECRRNYSISKKILATLNPHIVYVWHAANVLISPVLAAQAQGIPTIFNLGCYWLSELKAELCLEPNPIKRRYRAAIIGLRDFSCIDLKHILVNSKSLMQSYVELGFPKKNITVIPRGIPSHLILDDISLSNRSKSDKGEIKLVFAGRLDPDKGPDVAIKAVAHMVGEKDGAKIRLDIIGTGSDSYVKQLRNIVVTMGLEEKVQFLGQLEHHQLLRRYQEYDALLFTSRWVEPFSVIILEAMARGLPVIATDTGSVSEVISDGVNGLIVPKDEPELLAHAIKRIAQDTGLAQKLRYAALENIHEKYTLERIIDQSEEYLQMVIQQSCPL